MCCRTPGRDAFRIADDTATTIDFGVCMARSSVRKRTMENGVIGKGTDWVGDSGRKLIKE